MTESGPLLFLAVLTANVLGVGMLVPQTRRSIRTRSLQGVSAVWIGAGLAINLGWIFYALAREIWGLVPVSLGALMLYGALWVIVRGIDSDQAGRILTIGVAVAALVGAAAVIGGADGMGFTLASLYTIQFAPAAWTALTSSSLDGLSPTTWFMSLAEASIWVLYGISIDDGAVVAGGVGAAAMSAVVCGRVLTSWDRAPLGSYVYEHMNAVRLQR